jgi:hypothetical protein
MSVGMTRLEKHRGVPWRERKKFLDRDCVNVLEFDSGLIATLYRRGV